jgi:hypothetical protein
MTDTKTLTKADLMQFTGSEHWYRHALVRDTLHGWREACRRDSRGLLADR